MFTLPVNKCVSLLHHLSYDEILLQQLSLNVQDQIEVEIFITSLRFHSSVGVFLFLYKVTRVWRQG